MRELAADHPLAQPQLRECGGCGLVQAIPALEPGMAAHCARCRITLVSVARHPLDYSIALTVAALVLMVVMCTTHLMSVQTAGIMIDAGLFSGPEELSRRGMTGLGLVVVFVTVLAPVLKLSFTLYTLLRVNETPSPPHLRRVFAWAERLRPWSMIEVFVLGVFVAYVKLGDLVHIQLDAGVFALMALTIVLIWADTAIDREMIWELLARDDQGASIAYLDHHGSSHAEAVGCEICGFVSVPDEEHARCPRCLSRLHIRKPGSLSRTWALTLAAAIMYIPANYYPVLTVVQLGAGAPSTILGGVEELIDSKMYPLAALVFFASIAVPMLKLVGLITMLIATHTGHAGWLRDRTRLYYVVHWVGRWSMIDIFMEALLGALVRFGGVVTIVPGIGAVAFCAVVIMTMFAAESFDPRLMWDAAAARHRHLRPHAAE